jgi:uncharacterized protein YjgD (DUF1641 family)
MQAEWQMSNMENLVLTALKEKAPGLHRDLQAGGRLAEFVQERAEEMQAQIVSMTQAQRAKEKWDRLGPMECAAKMKQADALNREIVFSEMLEFPQDETSR